MDDLPDFEIARQVMQDVGLTLQEARSMPEVFGSWYICAQASGKLIRLVWDGRDSALTIQEPSLSGMQNDWVDRWIVGTGHKNKVSDLRDGLLAILAETSAEGR